MVVANNVHHISGEAPIFCAGLPAQKADVSAGHAANRYSMHIHMHIHTHTCMYVLVYIYTHNMHASTYDCTGTYACIYIYTHTCMHKQTYMNPGHMDSLFFVNPSASVSTI